MVADGVYVKFNLNHRVRVKLLAGGERAYELYWRDCGLEPLPLERDAEGYVEFQMHTLMSIFGPVTVFGSTPPFETDVYLRME